jgi:hypothetical protein
MTNKEIIQISKSKPKKISILCTFKSDLIDYLVDYLYSGVPRMPTSKSNFLCEYTH